VVAQPIVVDDRVYFGSYDHRLRCANLSTGEVAWQFAASDAIACGPVTHEDRLVFGSDDHFLYCLNGARDGPDETSFTEITEAQTVPREP
jgi:outer membrane protein assembly factor BamB